MTGDDTVADRALRVANRGAEERRNGYHQPDYPGPDEPPSLDDRREIMRVRRAGELLPAQRKRWLAKGRMAFRDVTVLVGGEGIGKSLFWVLTVACVTTGKACPLFGIPARDPAEVMLVFTEDDWTTDVLPRLEQAGADMNRVSVLCDSSDGSGSPEFPRHVRHVLDAEPKPALVVVDAWLDTVEANLMVRDTQQARRALHPWRNVATQTGAAVLLLSHTNRLGTGNTRDLYGATAVLRQKARMTLFAQMDADGFLTIGPDKANSTQTNTLATRFVVEKVQVYEPTDEDDGTVPRLRAVGFSDKTARDIAYANHVSQQGFSDPGGIPPHLKEFAEALREYIKDGEPCPADWPDGNRRLATDVYNAVEKMGASKDKAKRVKAGIGVEAKRGQGDDENWYWLLPSNDVGRQ